MRVYSVERMRIRGIYLVLREGEDKNAEGREK